MRVLYFFKLGFHTTHREEHILPRIPLQTRACTQATSQPACRDNATTRTQHPLDTAAGPIRRLVHLRLGSAAGSVSRVDGRDLSPIYVAYTYWGSIGIMEKKMETTIMGYIGILGHL